MMSRMCCSQKQIRRRRLIGGKWRETEEAQCQAESLDEAGQEALLLSEDPDPLGSPHEVGLMDLAVTSLCLEL